MVIITLSIDSKINKNFLEILKQFESNEVQIISEDKNFENTKLHLKSELEQIDNGNVTFFTMEEFDAITEKVVF